MSIKNLQQKSAFFINIVLPTALAVILFISSLFYLVIPAFENAMMDRKREMISELTNAATSILDKYYKDEIDSVLTRDEAQQTAISRLQYLRYGDENKDYFWITDMQPQMIMHPYRPELNGQSLTDFKDEHGKKLFVESVKIAREQGQGFVDYMWQWKDDSTHIVPKLSCVKAFKPWGWIVGTGIYIEDVKKEISTLSAKFVKISLFISLITALILTYVGRQSLRIEKKRRKAETELNESKEKYKSLVEASTEGLMMIIENQITFSNAVLQNMLKYNTDEIFLKSITDVAKLPNHITEKIKADPQNVHENALETKLIRKDGSTLDVVLNISPIMFNENEAIIVSVKDVSTDKQLKEELFQSKEKFQTLMDKLNLGIFRTTIDLKGKFLEANDTALKILGFKNFDELSNNYILDLFIDIDDKKSFRNKLLEKGFIKNHIIKLKRKNEQTAVVSVSLVIVKGDDNIARFCDGIIEDISVQKNTLDYSNDLLNEYISFSQLYYQPLKNVIKPAVFCKYNENINKVLQKMPSGNDSFILVQSDKDEILGFITDNEIRNIMLTDDENKPDKAYQIMSSPIVYLNENNIMIESLFIMKKHNSNYIVLKNNKGVITGYINRDSINLLQEYLPLNFSYFIEKSVTIDSLKNIRHNYINSIVPLIENNTHPNVIFHGLSLLSDSITKRTIELIIEDIGVAPVDFCFFSLGSDARKEQTLSTDQDNAIIYEDVNKEQEKAIRDYFDLFSQKVCTALNHIGYNFCKGNVMAMNSEWCKPLSTWKSYFTKWINKGNAKDLLDINIFFDIRPVYGNSQMTEELFSHIFELTAKNPAYLYHLTQNTLTLKPQVGFWGNILLETAGAPPETVNIKETLMPIVNFARIYALRNKYSHAGTLQRLHFLNENDILNEASFTNIQQAFDYLNSIRLKHQTALFKNKLKPDNLINTNSLSELDKTIIKKVLSHISSMLSKLSFDFKGTL